MGAWAFGEGVRNHWQIENNLHWQLDVTFREGESRIENKTGAFFVAVGTELNWCGVVFGYNDTWPSSEEALKVSR